MKVERLLDFYIDPDLDLYTSFLDRIKSGVYLTMDEDIFNNTFEKFINNQNNIIENGWGGTFRHELKKEFIEKNKLYEFEPILLQKGDNVFYKKINKNTAFLKLNFRGQIHPTNDLKKDYYNLLKEFIHNLDENIENLKNCDKLRVSPYIFKLYQAWGVISESSLDSFSKENQSSSLISKKDIMTIYLGFVNLKKDILKNEFPTRNLKIIESLYIEELPFTIKELDIYINKLYTPLFEKFSKEKIVVE